MTTYFEIFSSEFSEKCLKEENLKFIYTNDKKFYESFIMRLDNIKHPQLMDVIDEWVYRLNMRMVRKPMVYEDIVSPGPPALSPECRIR